MSEIKGSNFEILNRINMGKEGMFDARSGMENQLAEKLNAMKQGEKELQRLVNRGAIRLLSAPKQEAKEEELRFKAKGKFYGKHYGGGNYHIVDPEGLVIDQKSGGKDAVQPVIDELNEGLSEEE